MNNPNNDIEAHSEEHSFRDTMATADASGKRIWLYPKNSKGKYTNWRNALSVLFLAMLISGPFVRINGEPLLLIDILSRKFIILGKIFWPQDFHIFLLIMIAFVIFIGLFTVIYGRVFCGWVCPQTIFMESVFRKMEYWIEGDWKDRMQLDKQDWNAEKVFKKSVKHAVFFLLSFAIANLLLSYIIGSEKVLQILTTNPSDQLGTIAALLVFTVVFYWIYAKFREQVCTVICPYGRLQGVLLDKKSLVVIYDYIRGEKRAKFKMHESRKEIDKGDCIDCNHCVHVCPAGIDIRNGTQLECINCTACMDACDHVMKTVGLPKGLVRMDSEVGVAEGKPFRFTMRIMGYTAVLVVLLVFISCLLVFRSDVETSMLRTPGTLYQSLDDNKVSNLYTIKMINKTSGQIAVQVKVLSDKGELKLIGKDLVVPSQGMVETAAFVILDKKDIKKTKTDIKLGVYAGTKELETFSTTFIGPVY
ncbi:MAG: cytochrome c oxidase accessory protein CcoG [Cytophagaceae bacterium]|nr:cytochrome c oxidase accessory protein CcoG [Cytophagaceae bacterium]